MHPGRDRSVPHGRTVLPDADIHSSFIDPAITGLAADYVRSGINLATMEGASEAGLPNAYDVIEPYRPWPGDRTRGGTPAGAAEPYAEAPLS